MTTMTQYRVWLKDGQSFWFAADLIRAEKPISAAFDDPADEEHWSATPYQTADANHRLGKAAALCIHYFNVREELAAEQERTDYGCDCEDAIDHIEEREQA